MFLNFGCTQPSPIQTVGIRITKLDFIATPTLITLRKLYKFFYSSLILNTDAWWISQISIYTYMYWNCIWRMSIFSKWLIPYYGIGVTLSHQEDLLFSLIHINCKQHFLNFTNFFRYFTLVFRLHKMKVVINYNQICTRRSIQNKFNKYSLSLRYTLKNIYVLINLKKGLIILNCPTEQFKIQYI